MKKIKQTEFPGGGPVVYRGYGEQYALDRCKPQVTAIEQRLIAFRAVARDGYPGVGMKKDELPGLQCAGVMDTGRDQAWGMEIHRNDGVEICWVEHGQPTFRVDGHRCTLGPGSLTVTRPWQAHRHGDPLFEACRLHYCVMQVGSSRPHEDWTWPAWVVLSGTDRVELADRLRGTGQSVWPRAEEVGSWFQRLASSLPGAGPVPVSALAVSLNGLLLALLESLRSRRVEAEVGLASPAETVRRFWDDLRMSERVRNHEWTLEEMAVECAVGVTRFCALTRELHNQSPARLLQDVRLEHAAAALVREPRRSVTAIAFEHGFNSSQYFATCFRRRYRCPPLEYRRACLRKPSEADVPGGGGGRGWRARPSA